MINQSEANKRAKFFYNYLFGMKFIYKVRLVTQKELDRIEERYVRDNNLIERVGGCFGMFNTYSEYGSGDPAEASILISKSRCNSVIDFNETLIHELIHCGLWYQGREYEDGQDDFEHMLASCGLYSNWALMHEGADGRPLKGDPDKLAEYERLYQQSVANR